MIISLEISRTIQLHQNEAIWKELGLIKVQNNEDNLQIMKAEGEVLFQWAVFALWSGYTLRQEMDSLWVKSFK